eukprot:CAMPEP_0181100066 /NCGR_PEP_ID=MMETSP1071-20121207/12997_1 /TAXON_ID=35127 /ORGANISM="Thalassiosira sp., Strain NH16" /LENGTH=551 /DNA_ID=CAMNT_0023182775 /DNA_START=169 /DNA_END=1821 /DNA_ORIENTATION=+
MKSKRSTIAAAAFIATFALCPPSSFRVDAFQAAAPSSSSSSSFRSSLSSCNHRHPRIRSQSQSRLHTASKESTEIINDDSKDLQDDDEVAEDSWALRQITFLGLSAPSKENAPDGEDDADEDDDEDDASPRNALDARNLSEFLMEIGACSVSITDSDADTDDERPLFDEPSLTPCSNDLLKKDELLSDAELGEEWAMIIPDLAAGRNLWKRCDVSAHFPPSLDVPTIVDAVRYTFHCPSGPRYKVDDVPDRDWITHVQESWTPIVLGEGKFVLRFPWHDDAMVMRACQETESERMREAMARQFSSGVKREGAVVHFEDVDGDHDDMAADDDSDREYVQIRLEGGIAFGTGEHPTTRLCLDWVRDRVERRMDIDETLHFLDYGAGSGVLGIAAASVVRDHNDRSTRSRHQEQSPDARKSITTVGVEIDADAIHIADDNARKNGVEMTNYLPDTDSLDAEALSIVLRAMQRKRNVGLIKTLPDELNGPMYDLCAANILAYPLVNLAPTIASLVKSPGGEIGLSGVLATQAQSVVAAYDEFFEDVKVSGEEGGW